MSGHHDVTPQVEKRSGRFYLANIELSIAMAILLGFLILCSLQVVSRFVFSLPFTWTEELTAALVIWMTFLGAIAVERRDSQIRVELVREIFSPRVVAVIYGIFDLMIIACLIAMMIGGYHTLSETSYQKTPALGISFNLITAAVPLAAVPLLFFVVRNGLRRFRDGWAHKGGAE
ncbi:TRAP transporter small permease [Ahrensia sp. R2A130]|uniref:TRAP transporter small permease n=1 Tax=Ahrensia sp. R2A130 TaxID=744979 RepID=UPI0001E094C2|nr:TRAP transporter small permease [Ahrensia sp. R2A130]EFL88169.1 putative trapT DctQ-M fusion permease, dicarboxylate transport [Ahrensia sp. R2A130]